MLILYTVLFSFSFATCHISWTLHVDLFCVITWAIFSRSRLAYAAGSSLTLICRAMWFSQIGSSFNLFNCNVQENVLINRQKQSRLFFNSIVLKDQYPCAPSTKAPATYRAFAVLHIHTALRFLFLFSFFFFKYQCSGNIFLKVLCSVKV